MTVPLVGLKLVNVPLSVELCELDTLELEEWTVPSEELGLVDEVEFCCGGPVEVVEDPEGWVESVELKLVVAPLPVELFETGPVDDIEVPEDVLALPVELGLEIDVEFC